MLINNLNTEQGMTVAQLTESLLNKIKADQGSDQCDERFCVYARKYVSTLSPDLEVFIDRYPSEGSNGEDVYPEYARKNKLHLIYYGEHFVSVLELAVEQRPQIAVADAIKGLNYYNENDDFLDF
ncbi:MAG: DUF7716 domain-containing protein [Pseudomonas piscis]|uniref:DUF7716 domain-containing protein n=1 Tax=Pseudomonas piscis TaxID=2614538 RepID=UPI003D2D396D